MRIVLSLREYYYTTWLLASLVKRFTAAQDEYTRLIDEQVTRNRKSVKLQAFIDEIKNADTLNLEFNDRLFNLTVLNIKVHKENHL